MGPMRVNRESVPERDVTARALISIKREISSEDVPFYCIQALRVLIATQMQLQQ